MEPCEAFFYRKPTPKVPQLFASCSTPNFSASSPCANRKPRPSLLRPNTFKRYSAMPKSDFWSSWPNLLLIKTLGNAIHQPCFKIWRMYQHLIYSFAGLRTQLVKIPSKFHWWSATCWEAWMGFKGTENVAQCQYLFVKPIKSKRVSGPELLNY